ncbi:Uncharacterized protein TCM_024865 [Theobroma cacao]|uniref:Uncharacterized protein n=1 Tax=Theobroma cacao TaxID=3641 RepID=A0A061EYE1_THECC|nr:Uncharacterized protein TCM_024865 [Theobroma cacao]
MSFRRFSLLLFYPIGFLVSIGILRGFHRLCSPFGMFVLVGPDFSGRCLNYKGMKPPRPYKDKTKGRLLLSGVAFTGMGYSLRVLLGTTSELASIAAAGAYEEALPFRSVSRIIWIRFITGLGAYAVLHHAYTGILGFRL